MKKKIFLMISMCFLMFGLTACTKTDPTTVDYNGYSYDDLQSACQNTFATLVSLSDTDKESYLESGNDMTVALINSWDETIEESGDFVDFTDCTVTVSNDTLTVEQEAECANRDVVMTYVYDYSDMEPTAITVAPVYTIGETMKQAGLNTIMGISIVFCVLVLISFIISGFKVIPYLQDKYGKKEVKAPAKAAPVVQQAAVAETDDLELVAVIAAAIASATGTTTDDFVVRSIKRRR